MNAAQVHLIFNHWPLALIAVGFFILLYGELKLSVPSKTLGLSLLVIAALLTIPSQLSGYGAEEVLKEMDIVDHDLHEIIEHHAGLGFWTAMLAYGLGIFSFISLLMIHNTHAFFGYLRKLIIIAAAAGMVLMSITAHSGGEIRHPEIRMNVSSE